MLVSEAATESVIIEPKRADHVTFADYNPIVSGESNMFDNVRPKTE